MPSQAQRFGACHSPCFWSRSGGALGAALRYGSVEAVQRLMGNAFPWGTLFVNVVGSFALGFLLLAMERMELSEEVRHFAAIGVLGAFTTFSAFSWDIIWLMREGEWLRAGVYATGSVAVGVTALVAGGGLLASTVLSAPG
ncbi:MAG TPA: fluoride efflux transporter CrcB [Longimicrobiales bacterium]|nr:fluoride efflux transporter CrcB [Longimicrobiales bacterium]